MNKTEKLLPCPFCGQQPTEYAIEPHTHALQFSGGKMPDHQGSHVIECACGCGIIDATREEVFSVWNRRPTPCLHQIQEPAPVQVAPAVVAVPDERSAFEAWLGIKPCGAAHDFGWAAWQARAALAATPAADAPLYAEMLAALQSVGMDAVGVGGGENTISDSARAKVEAVLEKIGAPWPSSDTAAAAPVKVKDDA